MGGNFEEGVRVNDSVTCIGFVVYHWSTFDTRPKVYTTLEAATLAAQVRTLKVAALGSDQKLYRSYVEEGDGIRDMGVGDICTRWIPGIGGATHGAATHTKMLTW